MTDLSIIVPVYNEEAVLDEFFRRLGAVLASMSGFSAEIIFVNDGSTDSSQEILERLARADGRVKYISFSRNFGKEVSLIAGLKHCTGLAAIPIDADLQDPTELIPLLVERWKEGFDIVNATRANRDSDSVLKRKSAEWFYKVYNLMSDHPLPERTGDYRLVSRRAIDAILRLKDRSPFMKGLFNWVGFNTCSVDYVRPPRAAGSTKWNYWQLWNLGLRGIVSNTTFPLRVWTYIGGAISVLSFFYASFIFLRTLFLGVDVPGYASLSVCILFLGSVQLVALGIIGEYLGRVLTEVKHRPLYVVDKSFGFKDDAFNDD